MEIWGKAKPRTWKTWIFFGIWGRIFRTKKTTWRWGRVLSLCTDVNCVRLSFSMHRLSNERNFVTSMCATLTVMYEIVWINTNEKNTCGIIHNIKIISYIHVYIYICINKNTSVQCMKMSFFLAYLLVCCLPCQPWSFFTNQRPNLLTMMLFFQFPWKAMPTRTNEIATSSPDFRVSKTCQDFLRTINETCFFSAANWIYTFYTPGSSIGLTT